MDLLSILGRKADGKNGEQRIDQGCAWVLGFD
jgi:hypothetical protein